MWIRSWVFVPTFSNSQQWYPHYIHPNTCKEKVWIASKQTLFSITIGILCMYQTSSINESYAFLGYYAASSDSFRRFGTTCRSHFQGSRIQNFGFLSLETSVRNYHYSLRQNPEELSFFMAGAWNHESSINDESSKCNLEY